jgi:hypothetical protein
MEGEGKGQRLSRYARGKVSGPRTLSVGAEQGDAHPRLCGAGNELLESGEVNLLFLGEGRHDGAVAASTPTSQSAPQSSSAPCYAPSAASSTHTPLGKGRLAAPLVAPGMIDGDQLGAGLRVEVEGAAIAILCM